MKTQEEGEGLPPGRMRECGGGRRRTQEEGEGRKEEDKGWSTTRKTRKEREPACSPPVCL